MNRPVPLVGHPFPLQRHLMKLFPHPGTAGSATDTCIYHVCRARRVVENAFGRMRALFRIVQNGLECDIDDVNTVIWSCSVLHNICERLFDRCDAGWLDVVRCEDERWCQLLCTSSRSEAGSSGVAVHNSLLEYLSKNCTPCN